MIPYPTLPRLDGPRWAVCHVRPRCEKKFAALLDAGSIVNELPLLTIRHRYEGRLREYTKPLVPGYVFARLPEDYASKVYQGELLARVIPVHDQERLLADIETLRRIAEAGLPAFMQPCFAKGTRVRIKSGPLLGLIALVEDPSNFKGILVSIDVLRQGVLVPMRDVCLEVLDDPEPARISA